MSKRKAALPPVELRIVLVREQRVILDADLAAMYGVTTKALNQAVKRNLARFPEDFAFQLKAVEVKILQSQAAQDEELDTNRSQSVTGSRKHRDPRARPWAFTEHGALMAANILRSERAVEMSVHVVRAFVRQREQLATSEDLLHKLELIDHHLLEHDQALVIVWNKIKELARTAPPPLPTKPKPRIGFHP